MNFGCGPVWVGVLLVWNLGNLNQLFVMPLGWFLFWRSVRGVVCFVGCQGVRVTWFGLLGCLIDGWGLVVWPNVGLLVVNYLLHTCIWFLCMCMATTTGRLTWGVVFWLSLFVIAVPNLGCVGYVVKACTMLRLHWLVINCLLGCGHLVVLVGLWHNFCILSWLVQLKESKK